MFSDPNSGGDDANNPAANKRPVLSTSSSTASGPAEGSKRGGDTDRSAVSSASSKTDKNDQSPPGNLTDRSKSNEASDTTTMQKEESASATDSGRASPSPETNSGTLSRASSETSSVTLSREESEDAVTLTSGNSSRRQSNDQSSSGVFSPITAGTDGKCLLNQIIRGECVIKSMLNQVKLVPGLLRRPVSVLRSRQRFRVYNKV